MADWSPAIANEFIRLAANDGKMLNQMQLQKLVYIAHGWNLAINGTPLTHDAPVAWDYGPVYGELNNALRIYGSDGVTRQITNGEFMPGISVDDPRAPAVASLSDAERAVIERVYEIYGKFQAFQLSALTRRGTTPWKAVYADGAGKLKPIPPNDIKTYFIDLARQNAA